VRKNSTPNAKADEVAVPAVQTPGHRRANSSISGIPKLRSPMPGLSERPISGNVRKLPPQPSAASSPEKPVMRLKMQSPQKLRERVQNNQKVFESAGASFQDEIAKITEEIKVSRTPASARTLSSFEAKVTELSDTHSSMMTDLNSKLNALSKDINSSLQVSESRYKKLDELWKDTSAENEILYSRFNEELAKLMGQIRRGEGVEELRKRFTESQEENARLKKEIQRLRRENVGLKAQLRE
jgi:predicted  nucleic acid-binding Zn-ribbon protein